MFFSNFFFKERDKNKENGDLEAGNITIVETFTDVAADLPVIENPILNKDATARSINTTNESGHSISTSKKTEHSQSYLQYDALNFSQKMTMQLMSAGNTQSFASDDSFIKQFYDVANGPSVQIAFEVFSSYLLVGDLIRMGLTFYLENEKGYSMADIQKASMKSLLPVTIATLSAVFITWAGARAIHQPNTPRIILPRIAAMSRLGMTFGTLWQSVLNVAPESFSASQTASYLLFSFELLGFIIGRATFKPEQAQNSLPIFSNRAALCVAKPLFYAVADASATAALYRLGLFQLLSFAYILAGNTAEEDYTNTLNAQQEAFYYVAAIAFCLNLMRIPLLPKCLTAPANNATNFLYNMGKSAYNSTFIYSQLLGIPAVFINLNSRSNASLITNFTILFATFLPIILLTMASAENTHTYINATPDEDEFKTIKEHYIDPPLSAISSLFKRQETNNETENEGIEIKSANDMVI